MAELDLVVFTKVVDLNLSFLKKFKPPLLDLYNISYDHSMKMCPDRIGSEKH